jgi:hypothetical protein
MALPSDTQSGKTRLSKHLSKLNKINFRVLFIICLFFIINNTQIAFGVINDVEKPNFVLPIEPDDPEFRRKQALGAWLLGIFYGNAVIDDKASSDEPLIKITHRKKEFAYRSDDDKSGAVFLIKVVDAISDLFGGQSVKLQELGNLAWDEEVWKLYIEVTNPKVYEWAIANGVRPSMSLASIVLPVIPADQLSHFLRGFFESNGGSFYSYTDNKSGTQRFNLELKHRSKRLITGIRDSISQAIGIGILNEIKKPSRSARFSASSKYVLRLTKKAVVLKILAYLYQKHTLGTDEWDEVISYSRGEIEKFKKYGIWQEIQKV